MLTAAGGRQVRRGKKKKEENMYFEVKFSCRVNWMMNDGRCLLNRIPLAEPSRLSAHYNASVAAPSP